MNKEEGKNKRFKKYIQTCTAHGVTHIFIGKSSIRKVFWLFIVLACTSACLYNIIDRILFLASNPTTTAVTLTRQPEIDFPAVTICNLNLLKKDYLESLGLERVVFDLLLSGGSQDNCTQNIPDLPDITYQQMFTAGKQDLNNLIITCQYLGRDCHVKFVPTLTRLGVCYIFNSGRSDDAPILKTNGTGAGLGLRLILNISRHQYVASPNLDAGVKVVVHHQSEPPRPHDQGIAVPPGRNAFVSIRQLNVVDETEENCNSEGDVRSLNFIHNGLNYSFSACALDCFYSQIAQNCRCILSDEYNPPLEDFTLCTIRDMCCVLSQQTIFTACPCLHSCKNSLYEITNSYSSFQVDSYLEIVEQNITGLQEDLLMINIFYDTLSITNTVTSRVYDVVSLLSDIGGQLGLFLGISVITVVEFVVWILDEIKDRCLGISEGKMKQLCYKRKGEENDPLEMETSDDGNRSDSKYFGIEQFAAN